MDKWHTNKTAAAGFHCSDTDFSLACVHMCVCVCVHLQSVICSHTCVSQRLYPAAPLSCCHGELPSAYCERMGVCARACASSCVQLHDVLLTNGVCIRVCSCDHLAHMRVWQAAFRRVHASSAIKHGARCGAGVWWVRGSGRKRSLSSFSRAACRPHSLRLFCLRLL